MMPLLDNFNPSKIDREAMKLKQKESQSQRPEEYLEKQTLKRS
jgi:hypothetical protein